MYYFNKAAWLVLNPLAQVFALIALALVFRRRSRLWGGLALVWLLVWSSPLVTRPLAWGLEAPYAAQRFQNAADYSEADAIVLLGGGAGFDADQWLYPHLSDSAARNWQAARLFAAGKAPYVIPTGTGAAEADAPFLRALGVPDAALLLENDARNTEENVKLTLQLLRRKFPGKPRVKILLVTSAWHMRRAEKLCARYAPELDVVPAACDFASRKGAPFKPTEWYPSVDALNRNAALWKEYLGLVRYCL